jgi:hypothetical protein
MADVTILLFFLAIKIVPPLRVLTTTCLKTSIHGSRDLMKGHVEPDWLCTASVYLWVTDKHAA